MSARTGTS